MSKGIVRIDTNPIRIAPEKKIYTVVTKQMVLVNTSKIILEILSVFCLIFFSIREWGWALAFRGRGE